MITYSNYHGPQRGVIFDGDKMVPFTAEATKKVAHSAHLLALGSPEYAKAMTERADTGLCVAASARAAATK